MNTKQKEIERVTICFGIRGKEMKKYKLLFGIYCIAFVLCLTKTSVNASNNILNGEGTVQNPYEINSVHDFIVFANAVNSGVTFENCHIVQNINLDLKKLRQKNRTVYFQ